MLNHPCTKVCALQVCVVHVCVRVLKQPAEWGEHLHTVAQAFCLYTRILPSNASRPSRLWPPRGSRGALPLKSQLCLILSARQIFHSPAVHLRSMVHNPLISFLLYFWEPLCRFKRAWSTTPVILLLAPSSLVCGIKIKHQGTRCRIFSYSCCSVWCQFNIWMFNHSCSLLFMCRLLNVTVISIQI